MKKIILGSLLLLFFSSTFAQVVNYKNAKIDFKDQWEIQTGQNGELVALKEPTQEAFIMSIYYPKGVKEGMQFYIASQEETKRGMITVDGVKLVRENIHIGLTNGMKFQGNIYTTMHEKRFLISVSLGTNAGILLVTYEGKGINLDQAIVNFKTLAQGISIDKPKDGFLFNPSDLKQ